MGSREDNARRYEDSRALHAPHTALVRPVGVLQTDSLSNSYEDGEVGEDEVDEDNQHELISVGTHGKLYS